MKYFFFLLIWTQVSKVLVLILYLLVKITICGKSVWRIPSFWTSKDTRPMYFLQEEVSACSHWWSLSQCVDP